MDFITMEAHSGPYCYGPHEAYDSAVAQANNTFLNGYRIVKSTMTDYYCDGCGDIHYYCTLQVQTRVLSAPGESDLAIKLKAALAVKLK
jgi:hypothetical protein